jgi:hypothetical protein
MGALRTIARNVASNAAGYFVAIALALIVTPYALRMLGDQQYGVWNVIVSLTGYYGILDLGIRSAVAQYVTRHWSHGDVPALNRVLSTSLAVTSLIAIVLIGCSFVVATQCHWIFSATGEALASLQHAVLVFGIGVALSFPMAVFGSALHARERFEARDQRALPAGAAPRLRHRRARVGDDGQHDGRQSAAGGGRTPPAARRPDRAAPRRPADAAPAVRLRHLQLPGQLQ